ncbi:MAG TPA: CPBP family intramembrane glutamic endopeptidase [Thermoanaerobaculia bacterium]|nr:CPBP family intramembrane glutamic endopeptidase [Thermoanaerobaculia bacterium]
MEPLRLLGPLVLALVSATAVDQLTFTHGLMPPGFRQPWRRLAGSLVVAAVLYIGVFAALGMVGLERGPLPAEIPTLRLFWLHGMLVAALLLWLLLGFAGEPHTGVSLPRLFARQLGLSTAQPAKEVGIGFGLGLLVWPVLLVCMLVVVGTLYALGGENLLPRQPPALIVWIAGLPAGLKLALALSAGVVEEIFFRGFLQPRVGIGVSTLLFVLAHLSYDQPFLLVGVSILSLVFAGLVWWRQNLWPAIAAHFLFDAVQLLILIPWALHQWPQGGAKALGPLAGALLAAGSGLPW